jgi:hypothetical protein
MFRCVTVVAFVSLLLPSIAMGLPVISVSTLHCTTSPQFSGEADLTIDCVGDLLIESGSISVEGDLEIFASGALRLHDLTISAARLSLRAGDLLSLEGSQIFTEELAVGTGSGTPPSTNGTPPSGMITVGGFVIDLPSPPGSVILSPDISATYSAGTGTVALATPEPATYALLLAGIAALALVGRSRLVREPRQSARRNRGIGVCPSALDAA